MANGFGIGRGMGYGSGGRGFARGGGGGMGFGFRGSSPPWPYVGLGRGGLPRCGYFINTATGAPVRGVFPYAAYPYSPGFATGAGSYSHYAPAPPSSGGAPYAGQLDPEQELDFLKDQARVIGEQLEQIDGRIRKLENEK